MNQMIIDALKTADAIGFEKAAPLARDALIFREEVRAMCRADRCRSYGRTWSCPPGCGTLDEIREKVSAYTGGILVETIGEMEDVLKRSLRPCAATDAIFSPWAPDAAPFAGTAPIPTRRAASPNAPRPRWRRRDCSFPMSVKNAASPITTAKTQPPLSAVFSCGEISVRAHFFRALLAFDDGL